MGIREKEQQRTSVVGSLISQPKTRKENQGYGESQKIQRAYYLDPAVAKKLKIVAAQEDRSASDIVNLALRQYLGMREEA